MNLHELRSDCPINYVTELLGDKWSFLILRDIVFQHKSSYGDFLGSKEKIAPSILARRLASLHDNGFLRKQRDPENKAKFIYSPTDKTIGLIPLLVEMMLWSEQYSSLFISKERQADLRKIHSNKEAFVQETREHILTQASKYKDKKAHSH
ncbi:MAG TPA: helix-turn-helix domain-containing protein [Candidatus Saccharimonadales bacterium]|nr:helix-turn-helix domain-containing protein [Candidatus Saccharimonadales bacterium]